ncbi:ER membrane complex subunit 3 [Saitozyma podzolica]|uniref:ER membrane protein complex subunit 3 n=1 Tax=Saitozyma podzolica TaxID=1890683 RepID=A0A427YW37_9TREE|nr:ER membrane complex subunit 3 [Saitozyma podzolica]
MAVKAEQDLYLDPSIRDWVLVPITLIMVLVGILRHYVTVLLNSSPKKQPAAVVREQRALGRALLLRSTSPLSPLPPAQYKSFTSSLSASFSAGEWLRAKPKTESQDAVANPFEAGGMDGAMDGMKKQAVMMVPNMVLMQYISMFFSGFVLKISQILPGSCARGADDPSPSQTPLPAHPRIQVPALARPRHGRSGRPMGIRAVVVLPQPVWSEWRLQAHPRVGERRPIPSPHPLPALLVYHFNLKPLLGFESHIPGTILRPGRARPPPLTLTLPPHIAAADTRDLTSTMALSGAGTVPMGGPGAPDPEKLYKAEVENLALAEGMYRWVGEGVEARVLERWGRGAGKVGAK